MNKKKMALVHSVIALLLCCSMLIGTTFAWFTDSVTSGKNRIIAGNLDVELEYMDANGDWQPVNANTNVFEENTLWEPGHTEVVYLRVSNAGTLALTYQLGVNIATETGSINVAGEEFVLSDYIEFAAIEGVETAFASRDAARAAVQSAQILSTGYTQEGQLMAGDPADYVAFVVYMPETVGNEANYRTGEQAPKIELGINLYATQEVNEQDSFNKNYDANAKAEFFDGFQGGYAVAAVTADDQGVTTEEVAVSGGDVSAVIPAGVQVAEGATSLPVSVAKKEASDANIKLGESDEMRPLDVHIEGVAAGNTVPMLITLKHYLSTGINTGALRLYHVENGATVAMTQVATPANHNEFSYDPATGDVTLALASFSEVAVVADTTNTWDGKTENAYTGSGTEADPYLIASADQLAYFRTQVDKGNTFEGKFVKLKNNITLSGKNFDPIGWGYVNTDWNRNGRDGAVFQGTFDGNGKTIFDLYQNGWDLDPDKENYSNYTYTNCGFGLFAAASNAIFKDLTISGADIKTECVEMGVLVGLSQNSCTYNNIKILDSKIANYQRPAGGLIGEVSGDGTTTITKVVIGDDVVVGSLWGDFDAPVGGVIGARWDDQGKNPQIVMSYVDVGARLDVYNDITSAYQWHAYRRAGMLIGNTELTATNDPHKAAAPFLTCSNVKVYYGDWVNYHYCEFTNQDNTWARNYPWVRVEAGENCSAYSNPRYGQPAVDGVTVSTDDHTCTGEHHMLRQFSQLYGGGQGVYGQDKHDGVTYPANAYSITYVNDGKTLDIVYVTDNTKAFTVGSDQAQKLVLEWAEENIQGGTIAFGGWMNAASIKLTEIPKDNTKNVVLYPYFNSPYTATFVDQQGQILAWCLFNDGDVTRLQSAFGTAKENLPDPGEDFELINWQIRGTNTSGGTVKAELATNNTNWDSFKGYKDVTITPKYRYKGADLIEVYDELTGEIDHYQVAGYSGGVGSTIVELPAYVNGAPVTTINSNAFASYDDLHSVRIPGSIKEINYQAFTANQGGRDTVTLYYEGDPAVWNAAMTDYNNRKFNDNSLLKSGWDNYMGESSCVFFLDENGKVDRSKGYWELAEVRDPDSFLGLGRKFEWQYHNHAYGSNSGCGNEHNNKTDYTANCKCDIGTHTRPDKEYWIAN